MLFAQVCVGITIVELHVIGGATYIGTLHVGQDVAVDGVFLVINGYVCALAAGANVQVQGTRLVTDLIAMPAPRIILLGSEAIGPGGSKSNNDPVVVGALRPE